MERTETGVLGYRGSSQASDLGDRMAPRMVSEANRIGGMGRSGRGRVGVAPTESVFVGAEVVARRGEARRGGLSIGCGE